MGQLQYLNPSNLPHMCPQPLYQREKRVIGYRPTVQLVRQSYNEGLVGLVDRNVWNGLQDLEEEKKN